MGKENIHIVIDDYKSVYKRIKKSEGDYLYHSPFQQYSLYKFYSKQSGCKPFAFSGYYNDELIVSVSGVIFYETGLKKHLTKRAVVYGGPIIHKDSLNDKEVLSELLFIMRQRLKRKAIYLEFRNLFDYSCYTNIFLTKGFEYKPYVNYQLDTRNLETVFDQFNSEKRRQIRKAIKNGAYICDAESPNQVEQFYAILKNLYNNKIKKPLPPFSYFLNLYFTFRKNHNGSFALVCFQNKIIGGSVCTYSNGIIYDWYRCGLDKDFKKCYPSAMGVYSAINTGIEQGCSTFDFMGAGMLDKHYGVRDFKSQFGGELVEHGRYLLVLNPVRYNMGKIALGLKKRFT